MPNSENYPCPCCGYKTLPEEPPGTYNICELCFWEDDGIQFRDPDYESGANRESLRQAQQKFLARNSQSVLSWGRAVHKTDERDPLWQPLSGGKF